MLNVDASFLSPDFPSELVEVVRDYEGKWVLGFKRYTFSRDDLLAKLLGI